MHGAPSVEYPAGRSVFQARFEALLALSWLLTQACWAWGLGGRALPGAWWFAGLLGLLGCLAARWRARHVNEGHLCWVSAHGSPDPLPPGAGVGAAVPAGQWVWRSESYRHGTELAGLAWSLDLQDHVLLHLRNAAGLGWWVWLERRSAPESWDALRGALVAWRGSTRPGGR